MLQITAPSYKKTQIDSPKGLFIAREQKYFEGKFHIYRQKGITPLFSYNVETNRLVYIGGIAEISPEALADISALCMGIFDNDWPK